MEAFLASPSELHQSGRRLCKWSTNSLSSLSNLCFDIQLPSKTGAFITFAEALHMERSLTLLQQGLMQV